MRELRRVCESKPTKRIIPLIRGMHSLDDCKFIEGVHNVEVPAIVQTRVGRDRDECREEQGFVDKEMVSTKS